ncbi:hypothetical protein [Bacillus sp. FJAT-44742]|uniref:hypothetical protein n=1 Tax=Bacillus sp. FJAT-44742 TaxID=2014005 RepID=UPI0018E26F61|nr:hypothetical protein [Bacillus sp. FJAT-44742]
MHRQVDPILACLCNQGEFTGRMGIESADYLVEQGFQDVFNFGGGMEEWNGPLN